MNNSIAKLSIVTINLNNAEGLKKTFDSVSAQTIRDQVEFIVIDGASSDDSQYFIKSNKSEISKYLIEEDFGIYDAMNKGVAMASGDYLIFMNSGDTFFNENVCENFINHRLTADVVYGDALCVNQNGHTTTYIGDHNNILKKMPFNHQATFTKSRLLKQLLFNTGFSISGDYDFYLRAHKLGASFRKINLLVSRHQLDGTSVTNPVKSCIESAYALTHHYPNIDLTDTEYFAKILVQELCSTGDSRIKKMNYCLEKASSADRNLYSRAKNLTKAFYYFSAIAIDGLLFRRG